MELTFKIVLYKRHLKKNNAYNLKLRIYQSRDYKECSLGIDIPEKDWDNSFQMILTQNPNHKFFNTKLASVNQRLESLYFLMRMRKKLLHLQIINKIKRKEHKKSSLNLTL